ncbi:plexin A [Mytilus galloprovincialis]|uniref:Plexin A n=1 Tax=Mytilus galloprovincialis TaxID=29158 RepID=A0A8B6CHD1_MYTGA|nr:plexin A [Mytilus galloprovincialis]
MSSYKVEKQILKDENGLNGSITHFVHDNVTNMFYVGAVNRIFKLSKSLELQQQLVTGPEPDNHLCTGSGCDGKTKELTDNYNKILLIETNTNGNDRLVGSLIGSGPTLCTTMKSYYGGRISGVIGAQVQPAIVFQNTALNSVTLTTTSNFTVAFLGTSNGHVKKIVIENKTMAKEYDQELVIDEGSPINQDTFYDFDHRNLYLTSQRLVAKVPVENCGQYASCTTCLASKDPFCGWCTLENRCTLKSNCFMADQSSDRWKILTDCTAIDNISPPMASSTEDITLYMSIIDIPRDSNYSCVFDFGDKQQATPVSSWNFGISCKTPQIFSLGVDFGPTGSKNATLSIRSEETRKLFVSRFFTFYNCGSFSSKSMVMERRGPHLSKIDKAELVMCTYTTIPAKK